MNFELITTILGLATICAALYSIVRPWHNLSKAESLIRKKMAENTVESRSLQAAVSKLAQEPSSVQAAETANRLSELVAKIPSKELPKGEKSAFLEVLEQPSKRGRRNYAEKLVEGISLRDEVRISIREYLSITQIQTAALLSRKAGDIENQFAGQYNGPLNDELKAYTLGSLSSTASFIECSINELFADAAEQPNSQRFHGLTKDVTDGLAQFIKDPEDFKRFVQERHESRFNSKADVILSKYQYAVAMLRLPKLDETSKEFQDARIFLEFESKLSNFFPESVVVSDSEGDVPIHPFAEQLQAKFAGNPFSLAGGHRMFPALFISHGASKWAIKTTFDFTDSFWIYTGLPNPYHHVKSSCNTDLD